MAKDIAKETGAKKVKTSPNWGAPPSTTWTCATFGIQGITYRHMMQKLYETHITTCRISLHEI